MGGGLASGKSRGRSHCCLPFMNWENGQLNENGRMAVWTDKTAKGEKMKERNLSIILKKDVQNASEVI